MQEALEEFQRGVLSKAEGGGRVRLWSDMSKSRVMTLPRILEQIQGDRRAFAKHRAGQNRFNY